MDFEGFDEFMSSQSSSNKHPSISGGDLGPKPKWHGSAPGFCKQEMTVLVTHEDERRELKMAKIFADERSCNGSDVHSMLSFSSPNTQTAVTLPYYARTTTGYGSGGPFTPSQWLELEHQALIYKYITANAAIPSNLLIPIRKALENAYPGPHFRQNAFGWGGFHLGFSNSSDPEPGRCRRTDGKKWRCARDAVADQKYCERHMNRGRHRSRKPVEGRTGHSAAANIPPSTAATTTPAASATILGHFNSCSLQPGKTPKSFQDNSSVLNKAKNQLPEFGLVSSDSLLNPLRELDPKARNPLRQFMDDWPNSDRTRLSIMTTSMGPTSSSSSPTIERPNLSMGLGTGRKRVPISWESPMGGPLGEVLHHGANNGVVGALNLMSEG